MTTDDEVVALFRKEAGHVRGYLINVGGSPELADDCVNDAFLALARRDPSPSNPLAYVYTVARHQLNAAWKRARREPLTGLPEDVVDDSQADLLIRQEDHATVRRVLDRMPTSRAKETIILRYLCGFSLKETATIMCVRPGTVKRYTHDGLSIARRILEDDGKEETQ